METGIDFFHTATNVEILTFFHESQIFLMVSGMANALQIATYFAQNQFFISLFFPCSHIFNLLLHRSSFLCLMLSYLEIFFDHYSIPVCSKK
jgi:hypothetical protein